MKQIITSVIFLISSVSLVGHNVGVNIAVPESTLDIRSTSISEPSLLNISNQERSRYIRFFSGSDAYPSHSTSWHPNYNFLYATFDDITFEFTEYMRIKVLGRVGVGISTPQVRLEDDGGIKVNSLNEVCLSYRKLFSSFQLTNIL